MKTSFPNLKRMSGVLAERSDQPTIDHDHLGIRIESAIRAMPDNYVQVWGEWDSYTERVFKVTGDQARNALREIRRYLCLNQKQFARLLHLPASSYSRAESRQPTVALIEALKSLAWEREQQFEEAFQGESIESRVQSIRFNRNQQQC